MKILYRRLIYKLRGLHRRLFDKPNVKVGESLAYHGHICTGYYFDWKHCLWFVTTDRELAVSWGLEKWYRDNMKKEIKNERVD